MLAFDGFRRHHLAFEQLFRNYMMILEKSFLSKVKLRSHEIMCQSQSKKGPLSRRKTSPLRYRLSCALARVLVIYPCSKGWVLSVLQGH